MTDTAAAFPRPGPWQPAAIVEVRPETATAKTFRLALVEPSPHLAGQHYVVRLTAPDGYTASRSYSVASAPDDAAEIEITVERLEEGEVSSFLHDVAAVGDTIEVRGPIGGWFVWRGDTPAFLVGGGSGVVPLMAMLRLARRHGRSELVRLVVSARRPADLYYATELPGPETTIVYTRGRAAGLAPPAGAPGSRRPADRLVARCDRLRVRDLGVRRPRHRPAHGRRAVDRTDPRGTLRSDGMTEQFTVRPATPADLDAVVELAWQVAAEGVWIGMEVPFDRDRLRSRQAELLDADDGQLLVAAAGERVVGELHVRLARYGVADVGMFLLADWRGRGAGRALLDAGVGWARQAGAHKVDLEVWPHNQRAVALYQRAGFVVEGRRRVHYRRRNGERWDALIMGLVLEPPAWSARPVTDDDGWDLVALVAACWSEYPGCVMDVHGECPELLAPATAYQARGGRLWVVDGPGAIVASVAMAPGPGPAVELQKLYVARRVRRHGLARQLVAFVEGEAGAGGASQIELWSDTRFVDAHQLYRSLGYRPTGRTRRLGDLSHTEERHFVKAVT